MKKILIILFIIFTKFSLASSANSTSVTTDFGIEIKEGTYSEKCLNSLILCFENNYFSEPEDKVVAAIGLYLSNYESLSKHYPYHSVLQRMNEISKEVDSDLFLTEAQIYINGVYVPVDIDKGIHIVEGNPSFSYQNPVHLVFLGNAYWEKFKLTGKRDVTSYEQARYLLLKAYGFGERYSVQALAHVLIATNDVEDLELAGKVLKYIANSESATERDKLRYQRYLEFTKSP